MHTHINREKGSSAKKIVFAAIILGLIGVVLFETSLLFGGSDVSQKPDDPLNVLWSGNYVKEREYWRKQIDAVGTAKAYGLFKQDTSGKEFGISHTLAHIFGELIYEKEGVPGIALCDSEFAFGCYHSFFGRAISEHGEDVVPTLDDMCVKRWGPKGLGCPHGIGHGLLGYMGDDKLVEALDICATLSWKEPIGGCSSGVFMEFNFHTMQSLKGVENRPFDASKPLYPCDAVPGKFAQACYFELPPWLLSVNSGNDAKVGALCQKAPKGPGREACFKGLGNSIGSATTYDSDTSIARCSSMPDRAGELLCRAGVAWSFFAEPSARDRKDLPCGGLDSEERAYCLKEAEIII